MLIVRRHVVEQAWTGVILSAKPCKTKVRAVANSEPSKYGLVTRTKLGVASLPKWVKPGSSVKERTNAAGGLPGVKGDGTYRKNHQGTWETRQSGLTTQRKTGIHNRFFGFVRESEGLIVVKKSRNGDAAKEPWQVHVSVRRFENRLNIVLLREHW